MRDAGPPSPEATTGDDPSFSVTLCIRMPSTVFDAVESSVYRLLRTDRHDEHVDAWPEEGGRLLLAHAPVASTSPSDAMTIGRQLARAVLELCPDGSVLCQVQAHDWHADPPGCTTFWCPDEDQTSTGGAPAA